MAVTSKFTFRVVVHLWTNNDPYSARTMRQEQRNFESLGAAFSYRENMRGKPLVAKIEMLMLIDEYNTSTDKE